MSIHYKRNLLHEICYAAHYYNNYYKDNSCSKTHTMVTMTLFILSFPQIQYHPVTSILLHNIKL